MSAHSNEQVVRTTPVAESSPPEPAAPPTSVIDIPDSLPQAETTVYRDPKTVIRIRPTRTASDEFCLTMYRHLTPETEHLTPERCSNWREERFDSSPNTVNALPETVYDRYVEAVERLTSRFGLSVVRPTTGYGVCHRRHDSLGKHGVVSFEATLG
jgi:hypothetical protein